MPAETTQAEFWVVPDRTKDRRESFRALEIKILPPGTLTLEEETHKSLRGTVERAPTFPHRQSFGGGREGNLCRICGVCGVGISLKLPRKTLSFMECCEVGISRKFPCFCKWAFSGFDCCHSWLGSCLLLVESVRARQAYLFCVSVIPSAVFGVTCLFSLGLVRCVVYCTVGNRRCRRKGMVIVVAVRYRVRMCFEATAGLLRLMCDYLSATVIRLQKTFVCAVLFSGINGPDCPSPLCTGCVGC